MKYTEGISGNTAAILEDGVQLSISDILNRLNTADVIIELLKTESVNALLRLGFKRPSSCGLDECEDSGHIELYNIAKAIKLMV